MKINDFLNILEIDGLALVTVCISKDKSHVYVIYKIETNRNIDPKAERKAEEVIIYGMPYDKFVEKTGFKDED